MQILSKNYWGYTNKVLVNHMSLTMNLIYSLWEATLHRRKVRQWAKPVISTIREKAQKEEVHISLLGNAS